MNSWKKKLRLIIHSSAFPYILLLTISLIVGVAASDTLSVNADAVIYPYLFRDFQPDQLIFSEQHSNLLKFPLFILQSVIPYNYLTFTLVNLCLLSITTLGILFLGSKIIGKKHTLYISLALSALLVFSPMLVNNLIYTTVRNIEFPLIIWFIYELAGYLTGIRKVPRIRFFITLVALTVLLAGDFFFAYVSIAPVLALLGIIFVLKFKSLRTKRFMYIASAISICVSVLLAKILQKALDTLGLYDTNTNYLNASEPVSSIGELSYSLNVAAQQLASLFGISLTTIGGISVGILVSLFALGGVIGLILHLSKRIRQSKLDHQTLAQSLLLITAVGCFCVYVISGLTFVTNADGSLSPIDGARYLTFVPLLIALTVPFALTFMSSDRAKKRMLIVTCLILATTGAIYSTKERVDQWSLTNARQTAYTELSNTLSDKGVHTILSGYWTAPMLEFWSDNRFEYSIVAECNLPSIDNARRDWFTPDTLTSNRSALLISMQGGDLPFLGYCPADKLEQVYGKPAETNSFSRIETGLSQVNLWYYDYDLRTKLKPVPLP